MGADPVQCSLDWFFVEYAIRDRVLSPPAGERQREGEAVDVAALLVLVALTLSLSPRKAGSATSRERGRRTNRYRRPVEYALEATDEAATQRRHSKKGTPSTAYGRIPSSLISTPMPGFSESGMNPSSTIGPSNVTISSNIGLVWK